MRVSLRGLKDYVDITLPPAELAHRLTMAGIEVAASHTTGGNWDNVSVAAVVEVTPHPNADRLRLTKVDLGGETATVVCGALNLTLGQKVAFARVGAQLIN